MKQEKLRGGINFEDIKHLHSLAALRNLANLVARFSLEDSECLFPGLSCNVQARVNSTSSEEATNLRLAERAFSSV